MRGCLLPMLKFPADTSLSTERPPTVQFFSDLLRVMWHCRNVAETLAALLPNQELDAEASGSYKRP